MARSSKVRKPQRRFTIVRQTTWNVASTPPTTTALVERYDKILDWMRYIQDRTSYIQDTVTRMDEVLSRATIEHLPKPPTTTRTAADLLKDLEADIRRDVEAVWKLGRDEDWQIKEESDDE